MANPRDDLRKVGAEFKTARSTLDDLREQLRPLIVAALRDGVAQQEVIALSGYTRESVRTIAREAGIGPARTDRSQ